MIYMRNKKAFTLTELVIAIVLISSVIAMTLSIYLFFSKQLMTNREHYDMLSQINYAFEDMFVRCVSASQVDPDSVFTIASTAFMDSKAKFKFYGEKDIYNITPDDIMDNIWYEYRIDDDGSLILETQNASGNTKEVLIDAKYKPNVRFEWYKGYEPNFMTVDISATSIIQPQTQLSRREGVRFWFIDVKK